MHARSAVLSSTTDPRRPRCTACGITSVPSVLTMSYSTDHPCANQYYKVVNRVSVTKDDVMTSLLQNILAA